MSQANGTPGIILATPSCEGSPDLAYNLGAGEGNVKWGDRSGEVGCQGIPAGPDHVLLADPPEPSEAVLSPTSVGSATSADTTLDTTGDVTVEDVKEFLG